jgi:type III secretion protein J
MSLRITRPGIALLSFLAGCTVDIIHDLEETEANHVLATLDLKGIAADKARSVEGNRPSYAVRVRRADTTRAWRVLREENLPRPRRLGMSEVLGKVGLVPTAIQERAMVHHALAEEIGKTLQGLEGVVEARVHLVLPSRDPLLPPEAAPPAARASVLLRLSRELPIPREDVQRLVAGSVEGLRPEGVVVVTVSGQRTRENSPATGQVGPFVVAAQSTGPLRAAASSAGVLILLLCAALIFVGLRHRRLVKETARRAALASPHSGLASAERAGTNHDGAGSLDLLGRALSRSPRSDATGRK